MCPLRSIIKKEGLIGVVYDPYLDECFVGIEGVGSTCNGQTIRVSGNDFSHALMMVGTAPYNKEMADKTFAVLKRLFVETRDIRRSGSAALDLCYLALRQDRRLFLNRCCSPGTTVREASL